MSRETEHKHSSACRCEKHVGEDELRKLNIFILVLAGFGAQVVVDTRCRVEDIEQQGLYDEEVVERRSSEEGEAHDLYGDINIGF